MKIPIEKLKPFSTEIAPECSKLIGSLKNISGINKFSSTLDTITEWCSLFGKTEMGRWTDILNDCDAVLESATSVDQDEIMGVDKDDSLESPVISILRFTSLLFENTFSRSIYSSMDRIIKLLESRKVWIVVQTLRLLMVISKSSRFISQHMNNESRNEIYVRLMAIIEAWGSKLWGMQFGEFCSENFALPHSLSTLYLKPEFGSFTFDLNKAFAESFKELKTFISDSSIELQKAEQVLVFSKLRFAYSARNVNDRFYLVMARLVATSIIFYSRCLLGDESKLNMLASDHYIDQCCQVLKFDPAISKYQTLVDAMKTEALKTLASVVFLEKAKKVQLIVESMELRTYHGFCPTLLRSCIDRLKVGKIDAASGCSISFVTALFSLVYHIAGFESGGDALSHSTMVPVLLGVVNTYTLPEQHISFVTRSVRIIDILTNTDLVDFNSNDGIEAIVKRFTQEVSRCKLHMQIASTEGIPFLCNQQRSALMKSLLNFLKKAVLEVNLATHIRRIMETELPTSLIHIFDHPQYYGSSLLHCSLTLVTNFIYQEPAQLTMLQSKGLTDAIMKFIFNEKFPYSRDLICALPNVCSALCLNERGLNELKLFDGKKPLMQIFKIIYSNKFLLSMRKRKSEILETAHMLGTSFDEFIRHHPSLRKEVMSIIAEILDEMLAFDEDSVKDDKKSVISWGIGKIYAEEDSVILLPLGDYLAMLGIMLETMLTNRGVQENIQILNESGIPLRLVQLLTQAKKPNPVLLSSNYLPNLANILRFVMNQLNKVDDAFDHLVDCSATELNVFKNIDERSTPLQDRLCQATRLSVLISTMNSLMKSALHSQNSFDMRPYILKYFATDKGARTFIVSLFDTYKSMAADKLMNSVHQTTSQILEDTTKVRELLRIDDEFSEQQETPMELDLLVHSQTNTNTIPSAIMSSIQSSDSAPTIRASSSVEDRVDVASAPSSSQEMSLAGSTAGNLGSSAATTTSMTAETTATTSSFDPSERSLHHVTYRCHKQIAELIGCIGKIFCNPNIPRIRQRGQNVAQLDQATLKKYSTEVSTLLFDGLQRLLCVNETDKENLNTIHIAQSLGLLKKLLIDDSHNIHQLLPDFYKSHCHQTFFALVKDCLLLNIAKEEFIMTINAWMGIAQKLISTNLLNVAAKQGRTAAQIQQQKTSTLIDGFELKNYMATCQKETFSALCTMFKALVEHCEQQTSISTKVIVKDEAPYKLLEKLLESLKILLQNMMELVEQTEDKPDVSQEIPVNEIDPNKIQQLVEMGFSQSDAVDALLQNSSVPEAADYLIMMMERNSRASGAAASASSITTARSSSTATLMAPNPSDQMASAHPTTTAINGSEAPMANKSEPEPQSRKPYAELLPLTRDDFQERVEYLCKEVVGDCIRLLRRSRSVVIGLSELLAVFANDPLARSWVDGKLIAGVINDLNEHMDKLLSGKLVYGSEEEEEQSEQLAALMRLFCLVWKNFPNQKIYKRLNDGTSNYEFPFE